MKIGIIGDTHFGAGFNLGRTDPITQLNSRLLDFSNTFNNIIDEFVKRNVKLVAITGDIYEARHPTPVQLSMFSKCIQRAVSHDMKVIMVVGNHDQQRTIATTTIDIYNVLNLDKIVAFPNMDVYTIDENDKQTHLIMMPYRDRRMMVGATTNNEAIDKIRTEVKNLTSGLKGSKIAIGHFMIDKAITGETSEVFSISELVLPLDIFSGFDAVMMGHVHKHDVLSKNPLIMYVGSMEKITFGEKNHTKVAVVIDTDDITKTEIIKTKVRDLFEMDFDYTQNDKQYKHQITEQIISDIEKFDLRNNLKNSISKLSVRVKENDLYYVNQERLKEYIMNKKVSYLAPVQTSTISTRQLRSRDITETVDSKTAMTSYIKNLSETEAFKKKLLKYAIPLIEEVEGK